MYRINRRTNAESAMTNQRQMTKGRDSLHRYIGFAVQSFNDARWRSMITRFRFGILALVWLVTANHNDAGPTPVDARRAESAATKMNEHTNRLAHEKSPYLLQHAHNPVDWYPWGEEAFT